MPREIPDELVEAAARAFCTGGHGSHAHEQADCPALPVYRRQARAVLSAVSEAGYLIRKPDGFRFDLVAERERDEARAQAEALAEALEEWLAVSDAAATDWLEAAVGTARARLRAFRESQEADHAA